LLCLALAACGSVSVPGASTNDEPSPSADANVAPPPLGEAPTTGAVEATVVSITDGDTIRVLVDGAEYPLRYIGIDAAESGDRCAKAATALNTKLVDGRTVWLEVDVRETDRFDRLLRYVWLETQSGDWLLVNRELVRRGVAESKAYPPDTRYQKLFNRAQREASGAERGCLWAKPEPKPSATSSLVPLIPQLPTPTPAGGNCDPSYPDVCIPPYPPDLDCGDIPFRFFTVRPPDPHGFDAEGDGIGCEME
jgi:micrococcal nuclease